MIGLFGIGESMLTMEEGLRFDGLQARVEPRDVLRTIAHDAALLGRSAASAAIGCWMGITPGGPTAASFMSYGIAKRFSRRQTGSERASRKASSRPRPRTTPPARSAMLPMLALGVPGSATAAVMMGGLMIWGLNPGPMLFIERPDFVWGLIA